MKAITRIIITMDCHRNCNYCINQYPSVVEQANIISGPGSIPSYGTYVITGGEPLLDPDKLKSLIGSLRTINPSSRIYFHTTLFNGDLFDVLNIADGITLTLHDDMSRAELVNFKLVQENFGIFDRGDRTLFLNIGEGFRDTDIVQWELWDQIKRMRWLDGDNFEMTFEDLYILEDIEVVEMLKNYKIVLTGVRIETAFDWRILSTDTPKCGIIYHLAYKIHDRIVCLLAGSNWGNVKRHFVLAQYGHYELEAYLALLRDHQWEKRTF